MMSSEKPYVCGLLLQFYCIMLYFIRAQIFRILARNQGWQLLKVANPGQMLPARAGEPAVISYTDQWLWNCRKYGRSTLYSDYFDLALGFLLIISTVYYIFTPNFAKIHFYGWPNCAYKFLSWILRILANGTHSKIMQQK